MKIRRLIALPIAVSLLSSILIPKNVFATVQEYTIDNDPVASGFFGSCSSNMIYYSGMSGSYSGDMRIAWGSTGGAFYKWHYPSVCFNSTYGTISLKIYLDNVNFTEPAAYYAVEKTYGGGDDGGSYAPVGTLNQNTAPSGWCTAIISNIYSYSGENIISSRISVTNSNNNANLGADAINPTFTFWKELNYEQTFA